MAANNQRDALHSTIWAIANDLRGAIGGWDFKAYVLGSLFYRFISENTISYLNNLLKEAGIDADYADMADTREVIDIDAVNVELAQISAEGIALRDEINNLITAL